MDAVDRPCDRPCDRPDLNLRPLGVISTPPRVRRSLTPLDPICALTCTNILTRASLFDASCRSLPAFCAHFPPTLECAHGRKCSGGGSHMAWAPGLAGSVRAGMFAVQVRCTRSRSPFRPRPGSRSPCGGRAPRRCEDHSCEKQGDQVSQQPPAAALAAASPEHDARAPQQYALGAPRQMLRALANL